MEFIPPNKRTDEYLKTVFEEKGLHEIVKLHLAQVSDFYNFIQNVKWSSDDNKILMTHHDVCNLPWMSEDHYRFFFQLLWMRGYMKFVCKSRCYVLRACRFKSLNFCLSKIDTMYV